MSLPASRRIIEVYFDSKKKWSVKRRGCERSIKNGFEKMSDAIEHGRTIAINQKAELHVYRADGSIRSKDTFPNKPLW